jgi:hypothetical protein
LGDVTEGGGAVDAVEVSGETVADLDCWEEVVTLARGAATDVVGGPADVASTADWLRF